jgi:putative ABC transport system permease protein
MTARLRLWATLFCRESLRAHPRHKQPSARTTLRIKIGNAAVVLVVAVGRAGSARAEARLQDLGDNLVWIEAGSRNINGVRNGAHGTTTLTPEDAEAIRREVPLIKRVSPNLDGGVQLISQRTNWTARYRGVSPEYFDIKRWPVVLGAPFSADDVNHTASKVVIGRTVRQQLFAGLDPIGQVVRIQGQLFQVIGVLAPKGQTGWGRDQDDIVILPFTTALHKIRGKGFTWLDDILCSAVSPQAVNPAIDRIVALLRQRHHILPGQPDDFNIRRPDEIIKAQIQASDALALLLISIASVSLLVGGIGIMNVMLASVAQRTNEIGLRLAIGATERAVQLQFLGEAVMLSLFGGVAGVLLSGVGALGFQRVLGWPIHIEPEAVALAVVASAGVGIFFGFYPARRAARLDPIESLRHE